MPIVQLMIRAGRPPEVKRGLLEEVTGAVTRSLGVEADTVRVLLTEVPAAHWAVGGVTLAARDAEAAA